MSAQKKVKYTKQQACTPISDWTDLWFTNSKKAGYVAITDFKKQLFFGFNNIKKVKESTQSRPRQFISLNAFDVGWNCRDFSRKSTNLKQIRNIGIDIDQYKLGMSVEQALDELNILILNGIIPEPNLVLTSRGIQILYTINNGASPKMAWLALYITEQYISKMKHIGSDNIATGMSRVLRVPNSINERNNHVVTSDIWENMPYDLDELQSYCRPLERFSNNDKFKNNTHNLQSNGTLHWYYMTNNARLRDIKQLIEIRQGDFTGMRNILLYIYSYHQSLVLDTYEDVLHNVMNTFEKIFSKTDEDMCDSEIKKTTKSAYRNAEVFFKHFKSNGFRIIRKSNDGIIKPYTTENIINKLKITEEEQFELGSIRNNEIAKKQKANYTRIKELADGKRKYSLQEYKDIRKQAKLDKIDKLRQILKQFPRATQRELAPMMGVSVNTINKYMKSIKRRRR